MITMYDADAPTPSGLWHWALADLPADADRLDADAGTPGHADLPARAFHLANDIGVALRKCD